jgi:hypothetical protein
MVVILGTLAVGALGVRGASASCANPLVNLKSHIAPQAWDRGDSEHGATIVGMWHVAFIAEGNAPPLPPDGVQIDSTLSHWHSDGTEVTLSSRPPATGDVCLGVWQEVGERHYKLNHYGIAFDPSVDPNTPRGFDNIRQDITVSRDGKTFTGTFTIDQYDSAGNLLDEIKGDLVGTRVTLSTTVSDLLGS